MVRTQVYLTEEERNALRALAADSGKTQSQLIREAIDQLIKIKSATRRRKTIEDVAGLWKERKDLPAFEELRASWDRSRQR